MDKRSSQDNSKSNLEPKTVHPQLERAKEGLFKVLGQQVSKENSVQVSHSVGKPLNLTISVPGHHAEGLGELLNKKFKAEGLPVRLEMNAARGERETTYSLDIIPQEVYGKPDDISARRFARFFVDFEKARSLSAEELVHYDAAEKALTALPSILKDIRQRKEYHPEYGAQAQF